VFAVLASFAVAACGGGSLLDDMWGGDDPETPPDLQASGVNSLLPEGDEPVAKLYNEGLDLLRAGKYKKAAKQFEEVERQHPYSSWARRAILMTAYSHYERASYNDAILAARRFLSLHPGHEHAAYAYYLVGLSYYEQIVDVSRDQGNTVEALAALEEVERRFPGTLYARRGDRLSDHVAHTRSVGAAGGSLSGARNSQRGANRCRDPRA